MNPNFITTLVCLNLHLEMMHPSYKYYLFTGWKHPNAGPPGFWQNGTAERPRTALGWKRTGSNGFEPSLLLQLWFLGSNTFHMEVSWNRGTPKSSILLGFSRFFHYNPSILGYPHLWNPPSSFHFAVVCNGTVGNCVLKVSEELSTGTNIIGGWHRNTCLISDAHIHISIHMLHKCMGI